MSTSRATFMVNILNYTNGYITFNGFPTSWAPDPVEHGGPPVINATVKNISPTDNNPTAVQLLGVSDCWTTQVDGETQGQANFNMPDGSLLSIIWHVYYHTETNNDVNYNSISCPNYTVQYLQSDGSYSTTPYFGQSDVNTFTTTIKIIGAK